eukprot:672171-Prymnesium_polylepis.1
MLSEEQVAQGIIRSVCAGGWTRELLTFGQLAFVHRDTLFVHGGLAGGPWEGSGDGVDCFGHVPGRAERLTDAKEWIHALNEWKQAQLAEWLKQPLWAEPSEPGGAPTRAASAIIDYVCPVPRLRAVGGDGPAVGQEGHATAAVGRARLHSGCRKFY